MLALRGLCEGFARGSACLHTACPERSRRAHLPVPKIPAAKPCISLTSNLIQIKRLQVLHFGHLRKTEGRGGFSPWYRPGGWLTEWTERIPDTVDKWLALAGRGAYAVESDQCHGRKATIYSRI